jgi:hypothetical protein
MPRKDLEHIANDLPYKKIYSTVTTRPDGFDSTHHELTEDVDFSSYEFLVLSRDLVLSRFSLEELLSDIRCFLVKPPVKFHSKQGYCICASCFNRFSWATTLSDAGCPATFPRGSGAGRTICKECMLHRVPPLVMKKIQDNDLEEDPVSREREEEEEGKGKKRSRNE